MAANTGEGWKNANLRTQFLKKLSKAGVTPWGRLFHSMRASRQTELERDFPLHVVCSWLGNSPKVANRSYLLTTETDFEKAMSESGTESGTVNRRDNEKSGTFCGTVGSLNEPQAQEESPVNHRENVTFPKELAVNSTDGEEAERIRLPYTGSDILRTPSGLDTLFLTWQTDPTSTILIQWIGPKGLNPGIQYSALSDSLWLNGLVVEKPYPGTELVVYRCHLSELKPETEYQFQIVGCSDESFRFRTMPKKLTNTFQFVSGGDCATNSHATSNNLNAAKQDPHFVLLGGDLAYDDGRNPKTFARFLQNYRKCLVDTQGRLIPMISCIGNHEVQGGFLGTREGAPSYLSVFDGLFSERTYGVLDFGDYMSVVLSDSGHIAPIVGEQTEWMEHVLADRRERPHLIVANHVPAYTTSRTPPSESGQNGPGAQQRLHWCPLFEKYGVDFVLEHHDHTFKRTFPLVDGRKHKDGVVYLGDGSWGQLNSVTDLEKRPYLAKVSESYHMSIHRLEGDQRFHIAMDEHGKIADVYLTRGKRVSTGGH